MREGYEYKREHSQWVVVVFVLLGEAAGTSEQAKSQASRHGDEPWKHRTPPPWHHHTLHTDIKGSAESRGETASWIVLRWNLL